jgi:hypothetical protein
MNCGNGDEPYDGLCESSYLDSHDGYDVEGNFSHYGDDQRFPDDSDLLEKLFMQLFLGFFYVTYLMGCARSHTRKCLQNIEPDSDNVAATIFEACSVKPDTIVFQVKCWSEHENNQQQTYTQVSYSEDEVCTLACCNDNSDFSGLALANIQAIVKGWDNTGRSLIEIDSEWSVTDTDGSLEKAKQELHASNCHRDKYCSVTMKSCAPPKLFKKDGLSGTSFQIGALPCAISSGAFWVFSALLLTVPYRMYFGTKAGKVKIVFIKKVTGVAAGTTVGAQPATPVVLAPTSATVIGTVIDTAPAADPAAMILKLKGLLDAGAITQEEFDAKKAAQLAAM